MKPYIFGAIFTAVDIMILQDRPAHTAKKGENETPVLVLSRSPGIKKPDIKNRKEEIEMKAVLSVLVALPIAYLALLLITAWL